LHESGFFKKFKSQADTKVPISALLPVPLFFATFHPESPFYSGCWNRLFPIRILTLLRKIKKINELSAGALGYVEHIILQTDAGISQEGGFRMKTG